LLKYSPALPFSVLLFEGSGQVTIPCVKLSDIGIQGLNNDVAVMTNCQYGGRTRYHKRQKFHGKKTFAVFADF